MAAPFHRGRGENTRTEGRIEMSVDILALEQLPAEVEVKIDFAAKSCYYTWTGTTRDKLMPPYREER
jgi:hypothetical protein